LRVAVFRQQRDAADWVDAGVDDGTPVEIENNILARARELRISSL